MPRPIVLTILDGWGYRTETHGNAIALARKPVYDSLLRDFPNTLLRASDHFVGLPDGQMGNSEVGHLELWCAGKNRAHGHDAHRYGDCRRQLFYRPDASIRGGSSGKGRRAGRCTLISGCSSDGGVHSHQRHLYALLKFAAQQKLPRVYVHAFMDGRDTMPNSGLGYLGELQQQFRGIGVGRAGWRERALLRNGSRSALGEGAAGVRRVGDGASRGWDVFRCAGAGEGAVQQRHHGRIHSAVHGGG